MASSGEPRGRGVRQRHRARAAGGCAVTALQPPRELYVMLAASVALVTAVALGAFLVSALATVLAAGAAVLYAAALAAVLRRQRRQRRPAPDLAELFPADLDDEQAARRGAELYYQALRADAAAQAVDAAFVLTVSGTVAAAVTFAMVLVEVPGPAMSGLGAVVLAVAGAVAVARWSVRRGRSRAGLNVAALLDAARQALDEPQGGPQGGGGAGGGGGHR